MAITRVETYKQAYIGTAAERAAMVTTGIRLGSTFTESDTGLEYKWSGTAWFKLIYPASQEVLWEQN